jgi:hypothetical protein
MNVQTVSWGRSRAFFAATRPWAISFFSVVGRPSLILLFASLAFDCPVRLIASEDNAEQLIEPGIYYRNDKFPEVPWSIHIVKVERTRPEFDFLSTKAKDTILALSTLTDQIKLIPAEAGTPKVAINGDFYKTERERYPGDPRGLLIVRGELESGPIDRACLWIDTEGNPQMTNVVSQFRVTWPNGRSTPIGLNEDPTINLPVLFTPRLGQATGTSNRTDLILERDGHGPWLPLRIGEQYTARIREFKTGGNALLPTNLMVLSVSTPVLTKLAPVEKGALIRISTATIPDLKGVRTAIGGGPALLMAGKVVPLKKPDKPSASLAYSERSLFERHPRSALGWNERYFFFIEVDGRQKNLSMGMTLAELSDYMIKLGCTDGMNLDGGGSATIWLNGKVMNSPCFGYLRNTATTFVLVRKDKL